MRLDLGYLERCDGETGKCSEPDDEALIFIDDDNEKTIHIQCPGAKAIAQKIIAAMART